MDVSPAGNITTIPYPRTPTIGREAELAELDKLLRPGNVALLVLTGPGGVGKTRLAMEAAHAAAHRFSDGTGFVDLTPIDDPTLLAETIRQDLGLQDDGRAAPLEQIRAFLTDREFLLVLDCCEHVANGAPVLSDLLSACQGLTVLATSRVRLRLSIEHLYVVEPLPLPILTGVGSVETLDSFPAIRLFIQKAHAASPGFELTQENMEAVDAICRRLDGLPLAIELAATRMKVLSPISLRARLERRLPLLTDGPRDFPTRQRTMRDTIAWSYDLLDDSVKSCFRQISVFTGGFTMVAAEAVLQPEMPPTFDVFEAISILVDESLVRRHEGSQAELRFSMLDTIREYATEELSASGLEQSIRQRHADYFIRLADASRLAPFLPGGGKLFAELRLERPDLRAALEWLALGDARNLIRLTGSLGWFWSIYGSFSEGKMWLERALERSSEATVAEQASALCALGAMWNCLGNRQRALEICDQAVARFRETTDAHGLAVALRLCSIIDEGPAGQKRSKRRLTEALNLVDSQGDAAWAPFLEGTLLCDLGKIALSEGDIVLAESYHQQSIARMDDASQGLDEPPIMTCEPRFGLAEVFRARRQHAEALGWYQDCLRYAVLHGFQWAIVSAFAGIAGCLAASGRWAEAAHYFGVSDAFGDSTGVPFHSGAMDRQRAFGLPEPWLRADEPLGQYAELQDAIRHLQKTEFPPVPDVSAAEIHWAEGRLVALNDAISDALSIDPQCAAPGAPVNHPFGLTPREVEVLHLLVDGQSDRDIASTLFISSRTVEKHVQAILGKLNVTSRTAAATLALRRELG